MEGKRNSRLRFNVLAGFLEDQFSRDVESTGFQEFKMQSISLFSRLFRFIDSLKKRRRILLRQNDAVI